MFTRHDRGFGDIYGILMEDLDVEF